jgi:FKBP-type peptidyl-prolyl cis-trans isomerase FkpA
MDWRGRAALGAALLLGVACGPGSDSAPGGEEGGEAAADETVTTASGLQITELRAGSGPSPGPTDVVVVHYHGTFPDGRVFDSSVERGQPATFPLNRVIPCWTEGLQRMKVGGKARLVCPPQIAYGARGAPPRIPPNATLEFEVELLEIQ